MSSQNKLKITAEPARQELHIIREFEAPRDVVFKAFTDPEFLVRWLGPKNMTMTIEYYDARSGGSYRYIHTDPAGRRYAFRGVIHEVLAPERLIQTFEFEGLPEGGHVSMEIAIFEVLDGKRTKLTIQSVFRSVSDRDVMVKSGMEKGLSEGFARLDEIFTNEIP